MNGDELDKKNVNSNPETGIDEDSSNFSKNQSLDKESSVEFNNCVSGSKLSKDASSEEISNSQEENDSEKVFRDLMRSFRANSRVADCKKHREFIPASVIRAEKFKKARDRDKKRSR